MHEQTTRPNQVITIITFDEGLYKFTINSQELDKVCNDSYKLRENYPWIGDRKEVKKYISSMLTEDYVYENRLVKELRHYGNEDPYCYTGKHSFLFIDNDESFANAAPKKWYMNTGLHFPIYGDLYIKLVETSNTEESTGAINICFTTLSKEETKLRPICELFNKLRVKNSININSLNQALEEGETDRLFYTHILKQKTYTDGHTENRWNRLGRRYMKETDEDNTSYTLEEVQEKQTIQRLHSLWTKDIKYSLEEINKKPWLAVPITLSESMVDCEGIPYISQFAIPIYKDGDNRFPISALVVGCVYPQDDIHYFMEEFQKSEVRARQIIQLDINDLMFKHCTYEINTILKLDWVGNDTLFATNGYDGRNILSLWFKHYKYRYFFGNENSIDCSREYMGKIVYEAIENNIYKYYVAPNNQNGLIPIHHRELVKWMKMFNSKFYPGAKVRFRALYDQEKSIWKILYIKEIDRD